MRSARIRGKRGEPKIYSATFARDSNFHQVFRGNDISPSAMVSLHRGSRCATYHPPCPPRGGASERDRRREGARPTSLQQGVERD